MNKITVIATCLVNSNMIRDIEDAKAAVRMIFDSEFPDANFDDWNADIPELTADSIIHDVRWASRINVAKLISDLSE